MCAWSFRWRCIRGPGWGEGTGLSLSCNPVQGEDWGIFWKSTGGTHSLRAGKVSFDSADVLLWTMMT